MNLENKSIKIGAFLNKRGFTVVEKEMFLDEDGVKNALIQAAIPVLPNRIIIINVIVDTENNCILKYLFGLSCSETREEVLELVNEMNMNISNLRISIDKFNRILGNFAFNVSDIREIYDAIDNYTADILNPDLENVLHKLVLIGTNPKAYEEYLKKYS